MKKYIFRIVKIVVPKAITVKVLRFFSHKKNKCFLSKLKANILKFHANTLDPEKREVVAFLKNNPIAVFPYNFIKKYSKDAIQVFENESTGLKYVIHENKRLYFKRSLSTAAIKSLYKGLQIDQDPKSPHLYLTVDFNVNNTDVIADIGAAEGNFSLSNIEKVKKIYLFESNKEWIEALKETFKPWKHKVVIINKYVTDYDSKETIDINTFYTINKDITFFKVDIEGAEAKFLESCKKLFKELKNIKIAICTYHKHGDEEAFRCFLIQLGFKVTASKGYMIFIYDTFIKAPFLRKGLLRATKEVN